MKQKKGQVAMETIMIYGAALLVVTLAIGALIYFGVLDMGKFLPDKCDTGKEIMCESYVLNSDGSINLELRNRVGRNVVIKSIDVKGTADWPTIECSLSDASELVLNGELSTVMTLTGCGFPAKAVGKKVNAAIVVGYSVGESQLVQKSSGEIMATVAKGESQQAAVVEEPVVEEPPVEEPPVEEPPVEEPVI